MHITYILGHAQLCTDDYFSPNSFYAKGDFCVLPCSLARTRDKLDHLWSLSSHGKFLGVLRYNFAIFRSMQCYLTHD